MTKESIKQYMARGGKVKKLAAGPITEADTIEVKRENLDYFGSSGHRNYPKKKLHK